MASMLSGWFRLVAGEDFDLRCLSRSLVYLSTGRPLISAFPARICCANSLVPVSLMRVCNGSLVNLCHELVQSDFGVVGEHVLLILWDRKWMSTVVWLLLGEVEFLLGRCLWLAMVW